MQKINFNSKTGFTLMEILMVIGILGILMAILLPNMLRARYLGNESATVSNLKSFASAFENYASGYGGFYPQDFNALSNTNPPYFSYDLDGKTKSGYLLTVQWPTGADNSYTITAIAGPNAGRYDFRVRTGITLERSDFAEEDWRTDF